MGVCFDCLVTIDGVGGRGGLPGAGARGDEGGNATGQARGRTMTHAARHATAVIPSAARGLFAAPPRPLATLRVTGVRSDERRRPRAIYDLVVIGGGPAGLAAAAPGGACRRLDRPVRREPRRRRAQIYRGITSTPVTNRVDPGRGLAGRARRWPTRPRRAAR